jgi:hypothetical protein
MLRSQSGRRRLIKIVDSRRQSMTLDCQLDGVKRPSWSITTPRRGASPVPLESILIAGPKMLGFIAEPA